VRHGQQLALFRDTHLRILLNEARPPGERH
jgi:hypothetical protein